MEKENKPFVYHYCSLDTFLSIIQNNTIWLSDISKSNDFQECIFCRDQVKQIVEVCLKKMDREALQNWNFGYQLNPNIDTLGTIVYAACFSDEPDLLSQWRGYADDGFGVSIGISKESLLSVNGIIPYNLIFSRVIYDKDEQEKYIASIGAKVLKAIGEKGVGHVGLELNSNYLLDFPFCKNPSFKEEGEWRMVMLSRPGQKGIRNSICGFKFSETQYRVSNRNLVSYLHMDFSEIKREFIKEVIIGPKSKLTCEEVRDMLAANDYYDLEKGYSNSSPIAIKKSKSSYR